MPRRSGLPSTIPDPAARSRVAAGWLCLALLLVVLAAYWPALSAGFIWDDNGHVTRPELQSWAGLGRIWFEIGATQQYYPLLHSAFWLEHRLWGDAAFGYHLTNVLQHALAACLFAAVLRRLAVPGAWLAALLFALHPVCVESVAWISEQKNTLSAVLYLAAALAFFRWRSDVAGVGDPGPGLTGPGYNSAEAPARDRDQPTPAQRGSRPQVWYALATFLFVCALLTKTVTATLPAALLVVLWWRHGRLAWRRDVVPLLPWFVLGAASGLLTAWFERKLIGAEGADFTLTLLERGLLAGRVVWFYFGKLLWPANLTFIYPRWTIDAAAGWQWLFPLAALALLFALWRLACSGRAGSRPPAPDGAHLDAPTGSDPQPSSSAPASSGLSALSSGLSALRSGLSALRSSLSLRARRAPLAAALLFGGTLFPVLGFFNVYPFRYSYVADHFQYLATLPMFALAGAAVSLGLRYATSRGQADQPSRPRPARAGAPPARRPWQPLLRLAPAVLLLILGLLTFSQAGVYRDVITLYRTTLARNPASWLAHNNLAIVLTERGQLTEAMSHFLAALQLKPDFPQAENNLGDVLVRLNRVSEAIPRFERALQLEPRYAVAHRNLGMALAMSGRTEEAVAHFASAVQLQPTYAEAELYWAMALAQTGRAAEAIPHFERSLELDPNSADAHLGLAQALVQLGRRTEAEAHLREARRLASP